MSDDLLMEELMVESHPELMGEVDPAPAVDWLGLASAAFSGSTSYFDANVRPEVDAGIRQFRGLHPLGSKYLSDAWRGKSKIFRNKTRVAVRKNEADAAAAFFSSQDVVSVQGVDDANKLHLAAAEVYKALLQHRLTKSIPWFLTLMGAYQEAQVSKVVVSFNHWKYDEAKGIDKPCIDLRPIENVRIDPACDWTNPIGSTPYIIDMIPMYVKDVKAKIAKGEWSNMEERQLLSSANQSYDSTRQLREGKGQDSKGAVTAINDFTIVWVHRNIIEVDGLDWLYYTLGSFAMLSTPVPLLDEFPYGRPYTMGCVIIEPHNVYPSSLPNITKDSQAEINDLTNLGLESVKEGLNRRYKVKRGKMVDLRSLTRNVPGSVTLLDDMSDVAEFQFNNVASAAYPQIDRLNLDFDDMAGAFSGSSVQSNRKLNETVGGMSILSSNASRMSEYQLRTLVETWVEKTLNQLVLMERHYESDMVLLDVVGRKAGLKELGFDQVTEEMLQQEVVVTINVGIGSVNPQNQLERFVFGLRTALQFMPQLAAKLNPEEVGKEIFGKCGYKDGMRFFDLEKQDAVDPMQKMLQELEVKLKAATVDKVQAEAVSESIKSLFSAIQTAQTAVSVPGVTVVADAIAKSAGFIDKDAAPIYPVNGAMQPQEVPQIEQNSHPLYPANADRGMESGLHTQNDNLQGDDEGMGFN